MSTRKFQPPTNSNRIIATWLIDTLEQYKLGNVSKSLVISSLKEATHDLQVP